jgi:hypothetical protein
MFKIFIIAITALLLSCSSAEENTIEEFSVGTAKEDVLKKLKTEHGEPLLYGGDAIGNTYVTYDINSTLVTFRFEKNKFTKLETYRPPAPLK